MGFPGYPERSFTKGYPLYLTANSLFLIIPKHSCTYSHWGAEPTISDLLIWNWKLKKFLCVHGPEDQRPRSTCILDKWFLRPKDMLLWNAQVAQEICWATAVRHLDVFEISGISRVKLGYWVIFPPKCVPSRTTAVCSNWYPWKLLLHAYIFCHIEIRV